ncbi:uncharacterized protein TrAFT101_011399 [Trichoderma asperellum]|nr:hypothetical protein TrAFT101_011399 [Trichoderma asperellum]
MKPSKDITAATAVALNAVTALAATASFCATTNVCFQWGVPDASAKAGSGNVYFQLKAPTSEQWVGLGIGSSMPDSKMFIMYQDGKGNVTLSTRPGANHVMPIYKPRNDVTLLSGSGVVDGNMVANVRCGGCTDIDLAGSTDWIAAWKSGSALDETSPSAVLIQHDDTSQFSVNMSTASISSDSNPFVGTASSSNSGGTPGAVTVIGSSDSSTQTLGCAHGIIMSIVFICLYPVGAVIMLLIGKWYLHAAWQMIAFLGMWAGFGLGVTAAKRLDIFFDQTHTRMGTIIVVLLALQPIFGWLHHGYYVKNQSRGAISYVHIWYGRTLLIIGTINGGLGLQLANQSKGFIIAYSVVAGVIILIYLASIATTEEWFKHPNT